MGMISFSHCSHKKTGMPQVQLAIFSLIRLGMCGNGFGSNGQTQFAFGLNKGVPGRGIVVPTMPVQFELLEPKAASSCKPAGNLANVSQIVCPYYTGGEIPQHLPFDF
jgi:hypothetical protein